jgi:uncharacterized membrane protein YjdF
MRCSVVEVGGADRVGGSCARASSAVALMVRTIKKAANTRAGVTEGLLAQPLLIRPPGESTMLETIAVILIILWLLGMVSGYTLGNFIYVLLVIAIVLFLVRLISGRRV